MTFEDDLLFSLFRIIVTTSCTLGMMSTLTSFKYGVKKVLTIFGMYMLWVLASTAVILYFFGFHGVMRIFLLTISGPAIVLAYTMDKNSPAQSVFNYATQIIFSLIITLIVLLTNTALQGNQFTDICIRITCYGLVIFLEYRFLRTPFRRLTTVIKSGWLTLSLIPVFFCLLLVLIGTVPVMYIYNPISIIYIAATLVTMLVVYFVVYQSLMRQYHLQMMARDKDVLAVQVSSMNKQADAVFSAEKKLRILRHDVRHFAEMIHVLLRQEGTAQVEEVLSTLEASIHESTYKSYCDNYMVNSILTPYLETAEREDIIVKVNFIAPTADQINPTAFSVMLANALENALDACRQETGERSIDLRARMFNGQYLLELSNTCHAAVNFDKDGIPLSSKGEGHGIGTRSIMAFAKEQKAAVNFRTENGRFIMQMILGIW